MSLDRETRILGAATAAAQGAHPDRGDGADLGGDAVMRTGPWSGLVYQTVAQFDTYEAQAGRFETSDVEQADVATSMVRGKVEHRVVLDIDMEAELVPSSTPGHYHLYLDHELSWEQYRKLLEVLAEVGIVEEGYANASIARGFTAVRLPWVKKEAPAPATAPAEPGGWPF